jgi:hypothetical protein
MEHREIHMDVGNDSDLHDPKRPQRNARRRTSRISYLCGNPEESMTPQQDFPVRSHHLPIAMEDQDRLMGSG